MKGVQRPVIVWTRAFMWDVLLVGGNEGINELKGAYISSNASDTLRFRFPQLVSIHHFDINHFGE
jgi:hypothetical protein